MNRFPYDSNNKLITKSVRENQASFKSIADVSWGDFLTTPLALAMGVVKGDCHENLESV